MEISSLLDFYITNVLILAREKVISPRIKKLQNMMLSMINIEDKTPTAPSASIFSFSCVYRNALLPRGVSKIAKPSR